MRPWGACCIRGGMILVYLMIRLALSYTERNKFIIIHNPAKLHYPIKIKLLCYEGLKAAF